MQHSKECLETSQKLPRGFIINNSTGNAKKGHKNVKDLVLENDSKEYFHHVQGYVKCELLKLNKGLQMNIRSIAHYNSLSKGLDRHQV